MDNMEFQDKLIELLKNINTELNYQLNDIYEPYGLTSVQAMLLLELYKNGAQNIKDISINMSISKNNLSPLCKRLEKNGFIERERDQSDERCVNITMTNEGKNVAKELSNKITKNIIPSLTKIENEKRYKILDSLKILKEHLRK